MKFEYQECFGYVDPLTLDHAAGAAAVATLVLERPAHYVDCSAVGIESPDSVPEFATEISFAEKALVAPPPLEGYVQYGSSTPEDEERDTNGSGTAMEVSADDTPQTASVGAEPPFVPPVDGPPLLQGEGDPDDSGQPDDGFGVVQDLLRKVEVRDTVPLQIREVIDSIDYLHRTGEIGTPEQNLGFLQSMEYRQFEELLVTTAARATRSTIMLADRGPRGVVRAYDKEGMELITAYLPPVPADRKPLLQESLETAQQQPTAARAYSLLALQTSVIHPLWDGNVRVAHVLLNLQNRYAGSRADHSFLAGTLMVDNKMPHADLNARRLGLSAAFCEAATSRVLADIGYQGPPITGVHFDQKVPTETLFRSSIDQSLVTRMAREPYFNIPGLVQAITASGAPLEQYLRPAADGASVTIDLAKFYFELRYDVAERFDAINAALKREFVRSINALFSGDPAAEAMYGSVDDLMARIQAGKLRQPMP